MTPFELTSLPVVSTELTRCAEATTKGNAGLARVCARRAIGFAAVAAGVVPNGTSALAALRIFATDTRHSSDARLLATWLLDGERARLAGRPMIENPREAALTIIQTIACCSVSA